MTTNRLEQIEFREEPFDEYAQIVLRNNDLAVPNLIGYYVNLGLGDNTASGLRYGTYQRLWVKRQHKLSGGSKTQVTRGDATLKVLLELEGVGNICREELVLIGSAPFHNDNFGELTGKTIYGLLEYLIETTLYSITGSVFNWQLNPLGDQDDGLINLLVLEPVKDPNWPLINQDAPGRYETFIEVFERFLAWTGCYLRAKSGLVFEIVFPQSTDSVNETYHSSLSAGHVFYEETGIEHLKVPNHVRVYSDQSVDKDWSSFVQGDAFHEDEWNLSQGVYTGEYVPILVIKTDSRGILASETDADNLANYILDKAQAETFSGRVIVPHDARVELYDRVDVSDTRGT